MPAGVKFSPTCDLDYQVRTKSGEGQLTAACPRRGVNWTMRFGLRQGRSSDSSQQHARSTGGRQFSPTCDLDYQVRTKSGEGQPTAACPHRGNQIISYVWIVLPQVRTRTAHSSMPAHGGSQILSYVWIGLSRVRTKSSEVIWLNSDSSQQHAHTGGVRFTPTCKVNYQVRTKSGEVFGQLTAACPHRGCQIISYVWIELNYQVRTKSGEVIGHNSDSSQQHARRGSEIICYVRIGLSQVRTISHVRI